MNVPPRSVGNRWLDEQPEVMVCPFCDCRFHILLNEGTAGTSLASCYGESTTASVSFTSKVQVKTESK